MRVLHLNFSAQGGAGVGVQRLNKALLIIFIFSSEGHWNSSSYLKYPSSELNSLMLLLD